MIKKQSENGVFICREALNILTNPTPKPCINCGYVETKEDRERKEFHENPEEYGKKLAEEILAKVQQK